MSVTTYGSARSKRSIRRSARLTSMSFSGCSDNCWRSPMNTCLSKPTRRSTCKTSSAKAVSSAAKFPVCLSRRFCASIPTASQAVNVPEIIVHGATPLPISKTPICLEAVNPGVLGAFQ